MFVDVVDYSDLRLIAYSSSTLWNRLTIPTFYGGSLTAYLSVTHLNTSKHVCVDKSSSHSHIQYKCSTLFTCKYSVTEDLTVPDKSYETDEHKSSEWSDVTVVQTNEGGGERLHNHTASSLCTRIRRRVNS